MADKTYTVYFVNLVQAGTRINDPKGEGYYFDWDTTRINKTAEELKKLFQLVCDHANSKFKTAVVEQKDLATAAASIGTGELIVRMTKKSDSKIVAKLGKDAVKKDTGGATFDTKTKGTVSEVWIESAAGSNNVAELLARLAFHELMHNKIDASNSKDIHAKPDDGTGLAVSPVAWDTDPSDPNKKNMALRLDTVGQQLTQLDLP